MGVKEWFLKRFNFLVSVREKIIMSENKQYVNRKFISSLAILIIFLALVILFIPPFLDVSIYDTYYVIPIRLSLIILISAIGIVVFLFRRIVQRRLYRE